MAVRIRRNNLTSNQISTITKLLFLQPQSEEFTIATMSKDPILFYLVEQDEVIIPYKFSEILMGKKANGDKIFPSIPFEFKGNLIRDEYKDQPEVAKEALEQLKQHGTTLLGLFPGFGKTVLAAYLASQFGLITLVLYNRVHLGPQWEATFKEFTNANIWTVGTTQPEVYNVILCMDTQFEKIPPEIRRCIGCLIVDEAHSFCTPTQVKCLLGTEPLYIIFATATPERKSDGMHSMIHAICGTHGVFRKSKKPFTVVRFLTGIKPEIKTNRQGTMDWSNVVSQLCKNETRNGYILSLIQNNSEFKILVLTWHKEHAFNLYTWLKELGHSVAVLAGNKRVYSDSRILIGTISKIGTGFDEKYACSDFGGVRINMLLLVGSTKSESLIEQLVGRVLRADAPYVIDFIDEVPSIKRHWTTRKKWYLANGATNIQDIKANVFCQTHSTDTEELIRAQLECLNLK